MIYIRQDFFFHILMTFDFIMITRESDFIHAKAKGIIYLTPSILYLINLTPCTFHPFSFQTSIQTNISSAPSLSIPTNNASSSSSSSPPPQTPIPQTHKPYISRSPQVSTNYPNNPISHPSLPPRPLPQNTIAHISHITHHTSHTIPTHPTSPISNSTAHYLLINIPPTNLRILTGTKSKHTRVLRCYLVLGLYLACLCSL